MLDEARGVWNEGQNLRRSVSGEKGKLYVGTVVFDTIRLEGGGGRETVSCSTSGMSLC